MSHREQTRISTTIPVTRKGYAPTKFQARKKSLADFLTGSYDFNIQQQLELVRNNILGEFRVRKQKGFDQKSQAGKHPNH